MILFSIIISILLSTASFAWGYFQSGFENLAKYILAFGVLYFISRWRKWRWFSSLALFVSLFLSIFGLWFDLPLVWMFSGTIFALIAWDLNQFQEKLSLLPDREDKRGMTRRRLIRIAFLAVIGLMIAVGIELLFSN
ncbi:MAG: hypothetical protein JNK81_00615 [Anaerolineales bacterium]|nr:hypothetical protein [Anaerolineales bacterium]